MTKRPSIDTAGLRSTLVRALGVMAIGTALAAGAPATDERPPYLDPARPLEERVSDLLGRLTVDEKVALLHGDSKFTTAGVPRLGVPQRWLSDGPHGVREDVGPHSWEPAGRTDDFASYLPALVGLAASFDPELAREYGELIGREARQRGKHIMLGPGLNILRTPLNGRNFEYLGEDPLLTARMAVAYIRGVQSQDVASCAKHFAANNQEWERGTIDVEMDERTLREIYLPAFRAAVQEAGVLTVMGAYNKFRGQHCCHNDYLLNRVLKGEWGFKGLVMSDWSGTHDTREAAFGGLDLEMGTDGRSYDEYFLARPFREGLLRGEYPMALLDDKARRNLRVMFATGVVDGRAPGAINTPAHQATARRVAEAGIVLLRNEGGLLPLAAARAGRIAVIGENAVRLHARGGGSAGIKPFYEVAPLEGILRRAGAGADVTFSMGYAEKGGSELLARAERTAAQADVAVVVAGLTHSPHFDDEGTDRKELRLPYGQDELIERVARANPRTVVVLISGAPVEMHWLARVPAVLQAWYPGMEGGHALARVLFGDVNPSGKLPCTFPKRLEDSPAHALGAYPGQGGTVRYAEGLLVGYRWFDTKGIEPLFPFGHGLSYTSFDYSGLRLREGKDATGPLVTVEFELANVGEREGAEAAQVYVRDARSTLPRPDRELKAFRKVSLKPGERTRPSIGLDESAFAFYDPERKAWVAEAGDFQVLVGSSSRDIRLTGTFRLGRTIVGD
jgi:beta-glucosidase